MTKKAKLLWATVFTAVLIALVTANLALKPGSGPETATGISMLVLFFPAAWLWIRLFEQLITQEA